MTGDGPVSSADDRGHSFVIEKESCIPVRHPGVDTPTGPSPGRRAGIAHSVQMTKGAPLSCDDHTSELMMTGSIVGRI